MASFLVDENLSPKLAVWLRRLGHKAEAVRETELKGKSDDEIIDWAENHNLIIITADLDFGEFFYGKSLGGFGVIILRSKLQNATSFKKLLRKLHNEKVLKDQRLDRSLVVIDESGYRWRRFEKE